MKNLALLALASATLLLVSCGNRLPPASNLNTLTGSVVEGKFEGTSVTNVHLVTSAWTGGAGSVKGYFVNADGSLGQPGGPGALMADGKFSLTLPTPTAAQLTALDTDFWGDLDDDYDFVAACLPQIAVSDRSVRSANLLLAVDANKDGPIIPLASSTEGAAGQGKLNLSFGGLTYVDRSVTLKGARTCTVEGVTLDVRVDLRLGSGWNKVQFALAADEARKTASSSVVSGTFSSDNWVYLDPGQPSPMGAQSLKSLKLPFFR